MFTGIITDIGTVVGVERRGDLRLRVATRFDPAGIDLGASIACSGTCLTVIDRGKDEGGDGGWFDVDVSGETVARTAAGLWRQGARLNLERALRVGDELGGHIVTGHVDGVGRIVAADIVGGSVALRVALPAELAPAVAPKGSVTLDGISLTVNTVDDLAEGPLIGLNVIPHTAAVTTLDDLSLGRELNVEIDVLARYLRRMKDLDRALA